MTIDKPALRRILGLLLCMMAPLSVLAQGNTATVAGAPRVFVRRGPGANFPPFATVTQGTTVEVHDMQGEWARITTAAGQVGYINSTFLALPGEKLRAVPAAPPAASPAPVAAAGEPAALRSLTERNKTLETEVHNLEQQLADLRSRPEPTAAAAMPTAAVVVPAVAGTEKLHAELARLTTAVEDLQRKLDTRPLSEDAPSAGNAAADGNPHVISPTAILLGAVGILLGWLVGGSYGRRQERGRRSRIRF